MQPTFLPWLGWFDIFDQVDALVLLDDVPFSKQSWQQRNRIKTERGLEYLTLPVKTSGLSGQLIKDCEITGFDYSRKLIASLRANYSKSPFFKQYIDEVISVFNTCATTGKLVDINYELIKWMANKLKIETPVILASKLNVAGKRGEHVAKICQKLGVDRYLSPAGAEGYLLEDASAFEQRGISVLIHGYDHPKYPQRFPPFLPYASALDLIFNVGPAARDIMESGRLYSKEIIAHAKIIR